MEHLGLVELLTRTVQNVNKLNAWGGGWGSRGDSAATCGWWVP